MAEMLLFVDQHPQATLVIVVLVMLLVLGVTFVVADQLAARAERQDEARLAQEMRRRFPQAAERLEQRAAVRR